MQAADPFILAAMDGQESTAADVKSNGPTPLREESTMFFFVIFGLVYEALATSADSNLTTSTRQPMVTAALQALKCLVRPEYSGKALLEPTTFDEFISLCYRMAITESAGIQSQLVEMMASLASSQDQISQAAGSMK